MNHDAVILQMFTQNCLKSLHFNRIDIWYWQETLYGTQIHFCLDTLGVYFTVHKKSDAFPVLHMER